jgi:hypothetical protein
LAIRDRNCIFVYANKNNPSLSRLPKYKNKEKWQEIIGKAKLCFGDIHLWRVREQIEKEKPSTFPYSSAVHYFLIAVNTRIVNYNECLAVNPQGHGIDKLDKPVGTDALGSREPQITVSAVNHSEYVESLCLLRGNINILPTELPAVGYIALRADMAFISKVKGYTPLFSHIFKFLQLLGLAILEMRRGCSLGAFSYSPISCANALKNV